ncbi:MAG: MBL fold metallo-hydrolase [Erysipelotrichaceae bacterium]|nr:MBL fold metallo-hydrolase [Erysipelotrichaceae bacterium]MDY5252300.1 MBL fold metallo-hydrolase [Erysipelotrichaceae bacterium]
MEVKTIVVGFFATNCYLLIENGHCLIIDPGKKADKIIASVGELVVDAICLTHGHFDHIQAVDELAEHYACPIYIDQEDEKLIRNCPYNKMAGYTGKIVHDVLNYTYPLIKIKDYQLQIIKASGHTDGSVLLLYKGVMFAGDVLFKGSIGRCDLYSGNDAKMHQSLKMIKELDPDLIVYPGHGEATTLAEELQNNYYLR